MKTSFSERRIVPLSAVVANQIAAGEVIERPASVVKELLENAWDAGADTLHIDIGFGGLNLIKISDNGAGIVADDLPLAILAHATSKITELNDLYAIESMGFRGEALASIAAVSRLSILSKPALQEHAMLLQMDDAAQAVLLPSARAVGTTVEVQDLFFNAPVRKKFLKSAHHEYLAIESVVKRFALSAMGVTITLKHNGQQMLALPAATDDATRLLRIQKVLGKAFIDQAIFLEVEQANVRLSGWVSGPSYQRSQNDKQWVYINQRMVKDKLIHHAIKQAYDNLLHPGRYPACLLYLTLPADAVDVNVHPTKHEVRFQEPKWIHDFIRSHLARVLLTVNSSMSTCPETLPTAPPLRRESSSYSALSTVTSMTVASDNHWTVLNDGYVLLFLDGLPYCVDVARIENERLLTLLKDTSYPLASRPLLVPVRYTMTMWDESFCEALKEHLVSLGIALNWVSKTEIRVLSIPMLCPRLDISRFLLGLAPPLLPLPSLLALLVESQSLQLMQWSSAERETLITYLHARLAANQSVPGCVALDETVCRTLTGGTYYGR